MADRADARRGGRSADLLAARQHAARPAPPADQGADPDPLGGARPPYAAELRRYHRCRHRCRDKARHHPWRRPSGGARSARRRRRGDPRLHGLTAPAQWGGSEMSGLLHGHIAAITGAGSGIGRAIALGYAREGARVIVLDINADAAAAIETVIRDQGGNARSLRLDVTERESCRAIAAEIEKSIGRVSILVNNAGINRRNAFTGDASAVIKDWEDVLAVNLGGVFNVTHAFLEQLRA